MDAKPVGRKMQLAVIVSHPIQYYAPLYRQLAKRDDVVLKVFFTWYAAAVPQRDYGFGLVILEALAFGLPFISSDSTVAVDIADASVGRVIHTGDLDMLV